MLICLLSEKSAFLTYDIDRNNHFKIRDITYVLDCRVERKKESQLISVNTTVPAYYDPNKSVD